jgi:light-regulated signal transduction histidine kinase (bacteriophytochrome)
VRALKVLIADDDELTRLMLERYLVSWHYEIVTAVDGTDAWDILKSEDSIQMAILDWLMPGLQGIELSWKIKSDLGRPIYVLLLTVNSEPEDIAIGLDAGADEYVIKPFDKRELRARLRAGERIVGLENDLVRQVRELEAAQEKLQQSNRDLEAFAYIASHDLREPLRKIRVFSGRLAASYSSLLPEQALHYLDRIGAVADRMEHLVGGLLDLSRVSRRLRARVPVDLNQIAREVLCDLDVAIDTSGAIVEVAELPTVLADPLQMRQLLQNLIGNAIKFHAAGASPAVKIYSEQNGEPTASLIVEDNGIGFDSRQVDKIFLPFKRLNGRNEYEGSGMGLTICRKIVDSHGGTITADSEKGKGSRFVVTLPSAQT